MSKALLDTAPGFVLESADSVRFGPEYTAAEQERNRQVLFGEMLCGLLMGEQFWTSAVFAFDSRGTVEVLGAVSRAFQRKRGSGEQFLPFIISAYAGDKVPQSGLDREWENPAEFFLRCYAHRMWNHGGFKLSATPDLENDEVRRRQLAEQLLNASGKPMLDLNELKLEGGVEARHFQDISDIDQFLRSWFGAAATSPFQKYLTDTNVQERPVRLNRGGWKQRYARPDSIPKLRYFLDRAVRSPVFKALRFARNEVAQVLSSVLSLPEDHSCFVNRTAFRNWLRAPGQGLSETSDTYRILIELVDGHYIRTQCAELAFAQREVTSPASRTEASQLGEIWAAQAMESCLSSPGGNSSWQFINEIGVAVTPNPPALDLDKVAKTFAAYMDHPDRWNELKVYHEHLATARTMHAKPADAGDAFKRLQDHVEGCVNSINAHMHDTGTQFHFNVNDSTTCAGSLTLTFSGNQATSQCTGPKDMFLKEGGSRGTNTRLEAS